MLVPELFTQINAAYRGSDDDAPTTGTDFTLWIATANRKQAEWARDAKQQWMSSFLLEKPSEPGTVATVADTSLTGTDTYFTDYNVGDTIVVSGETIRTIATIVSDTSLTVSVAFNNTNPSATFTHQTIITAGVQSYSVHRSFLNPANKAFGSWTAQDIKYSIIKPQESRMRYYKTTYLSGRNPQIVTFGDDIKADDPIVGGTFNMPGFYLPDNLVDANSIVSVDDPYWLVYATASELAFNDITYSDKTPDLNNKANNLYSIMANNNRRGTNDSPRITPTKVNRILDPYHETGLGTI